MRCRIVLLYAISIVLLCTAILPLQGADKKVVPSSLTAEQQQNIIRDVSKILLDSYVFPETAARMSGAITERLKKGEYAGLKDPREFADAVGKELLAISKDKHVGFAFDPESAADLQQARSKDQAEVQKAAEKQLQEQRKNNFGFYRVERLGGNVGYLDFRYFAEAKDAAETAIAALNFLSNCDAIIIDLTRNGGGDTTQIQLIDSYFLPPSTHLNDIYSRKEDSTENYWTLPWVPGRRMEKVDLYILTSNFTFSGAEEFAYTMKNLKRATLVGETTGGGAHPVEFVAVQADYVLKVPYARAINPITKTNWEGTGIVPDVPVKAADAFNVAYELALEKLAARASDEQTKNELSWHLFAAKAKSKPARPAREVLESYAGDYGERHVTYENGELYYQRTGRPNKYRLLPLTDTLFALDGIEEFRVEFVVDNGKVDMLIGLYSNGEKQPSKRTIRQ